ncbi:MAG: metallophosphoesterase [Candidatus Micrarchaeota archaeon]
MKKILVLSDIHFPHPYSRHFEKVIRKEKPDLVVLLGDNVSPFSKQSLVRTYEKFISIYKKVFPLNRTVFILGDNDGLDNRYRPNKEVILYLSFMPKLNSNFFEWRYKNLVFTHGNIESSYKEEKAYFIIAKILTYINKWIVPKVVSKALKLKLRAKNGTFIFAGHIHYLGNVDSVYFCGTFSKEKLLYDKNESLGYVVIRDNGKVISKKDIRLVKLRI